MCISLDTMVREKRYLCIVILKFIKLCLVYRIYDDIVEVLVLSSYGHYI